LEASKIKIKETVPASRKLQVGEAKTLLGSASKLIVAKGKKVDEFKLSTASVDEAATAMLGPTGNLRAPTLRVGKTLVVGYNEGVYQKLFG
jgi:arsenate reductase-like glutaredoxin family protein